MLTSIPMLLLVALRCGYRMFTKDWQEEPDNPGLGQFLLLLTALAAVVMLSASAAAAR